MAESERRRLDKERSAELKRELNEDQLITLRGLEQFGWELKFIRRPPFLAKVAVVFRWRPQILCRYRSRRHIE